MVGWMRGVGGLRRAGWMARRGCCGDATGLLRGGCGAAARRLRGCCAADAGLLRGGCGDAAQRMRGGCGGRGFGVRGPRGSGSSRPGTGQVNLFVLFLRYEGRPPRVGGRPREGLRGPASRGERAAAPCVAPAAAAPTLRRGPNVAPSRPGPEPATTPRCARAPSWASKRCTPQEPKVPGKCPGIRLPRSIFLHIYILFYKYIIYTFHLFLGPGVGVPV